MLVEKEKVRMIIKDIRKGKKIRMSLFSYIVLSLTASGVVWIFALKRWMFQGIYIPEIDFAIGDTVMFLVCILVCEALTMIGIATSFLEPTLVNALASSGIPICLVFALFTAEKDFRLTCIIVGLSFLLPVLLAVWLYHHSRKEWDDVIDVYLSARMGVAVLLAIGILPWTTWNLFSEITSDTTPIQFSAEIDVSQTGEKKEFHYLNDLDQMWKSYPSIERFSAVQELVEYECERLGIASVKLEAEKREIAFQLSIYDSEKKLMILDIITLRTSSFEDALSDLLRTCREKYQYEMMECMEELEAEGKNIKAMPDFSWGYQLLEMERLVEDKKMGWQTHIDIITDDMKEWQEKEMEHLKETFGWEL
ncbi:MAG: hypothetical protein IJ733_02675 [Lachnospiraceae bacterium]|nr:hypothetical protein [Lachnospiraceae bacterium]